MNGSNAMILVSECLAGVYCRLDGGTNYIPEIKDLVDRGFAVTACPEVLGGLSTPREPREVRDGCVVSRIGADVTPQFRSGAEKTLEFCEANGCKLAILKAKSPSCGKGVIHNGHFDGSLVSGNGFTAQLLMDHGIEVFTEQERLERQGKSE